jgi:hypothetical protein
MDIIPMTRSEQDELVRLFSLYHVAYAEVRSRQCPRWPRRGRSAILLRLIVLRRGFCALCTVSPIETGHWLPDEGIG